MVFRNLQIGILFFSLTIKFGIAQEYDIQTTLGLGIGPSFPMGSFKSKNSTNYSSGYASPNYTGIKFTMEQNLGNFLGISANFYSMYYKFDVKGFEKSLMLNNRGLPQYNQSYYEIRDTTTEWNVTVANFGVYYHSYIGEKKKALFNVIGAATITQMYSPTFLVITKDSSNNIIETRTIPYSESWREVFLFPPIDGFSLELNARYFLTKHISTNLTLHYANSLVLFDSKEKALINMPEVKFQAFSALVSINYTFFHNKRKADKK